MILDRFNLGGKVALVTGAGSGLGQAMTAALASDASSCITRANIFEDGGGWL